MGLHPPWLQSCPIPYLVCQSLPLLVHLSAMLEAKYLVWCPCASNKWLFSVYLNHQNWVECKEECHAVPMQERTNGSHLAYMNHHESYCKLLLYPNRFISSYLSLWLINEHASTICLHPREWPTTRKVSYLRRRSSNRQANISARSWLSRVAVENWYARRAAWRPISIATAPTMDAGVGNLRWLRRFQFWLMR